MRFSKFILVLEILFIISATAPARAVLPSQTFTAKPNPGYTVDTWKVDGIAVQSGGTTYRLSNIAGNHNVTVSFKPLDTNNNTNTDTNTVNFFGNFSSNKNMKLIVKDRNGTDVMFAISGPGYGEANPSANDFGQITLYNTTEKSVLKISSKTKATIGDVKVNGSLRSIMAKTADLKGDLTITGSVGFVTFDNAAGAHTIRIDRSFQAGVIMKFNQVNGLSVNSKAAIKSISAAKWTDGSIVAPSIGNISVKGNKKQGIPGNLDADIIVSGAINNMRVAGTLSGLLDCGSVKNLNASTIDTADLTLSKNPDAKVPALGKLNVKNWMSSSSILSAGNIGTVSTGGFADSSCFAGIASLNDENADDVLDLPGADTGNFVSAAVIKGIKIKGLKGVSNYCFVNSNIAASQILNASVAYPENDNDGISFGLSAGFIKSLKIKSAQGTKSWKNLDSTGNSLQFNDAEIRLH